ncbi:glycosyltransferase family 2 protein [Aureimonas pseudogalii]|uniref:GT2 family glycosyltransferase n=1 Tax=Aureimonas pseudogalii TaxID=1744844 RepID=A0A7W6EA09_9HYPH|nr:glycosyltransferase [Aureimonas pseudogalii]MBB3997029.1 GT2 family glycosyltransferase [Aureimonas pseudogalii]
MTAFLASPLPPTVVVETASTPLREAEVVVVVPTFRRPEAVLRTLASLEAQVTRQRFAVVLVENDGEGREGVAAARPLFETGRLSGLVVTQHERGNCSAYNAGFAAARRAFPAHRFVMIVDDDETAPPDWIERLTAATECLGADCVGAPQIPVFDDPALAHAARHPVFRAPYAQTGLVPILFSSGNVCIRAEVLAAVGEPALDAAFNFIGGGDADFYTRVRDLGFRFGWCSEAPVHETMPARRAEFSWLHARALRNGAISSLIEHRRRAGWRGRARTLAKSLGLLAAAPARSLALGWQTRSAVIGLYHLQVALGRFQAEFGTVGEQYRNAESN